MFLFAIERCVFVCFYVQPLTETKESVTEI